MTTHSAYRRAPHFARRVAAAVLFAVVVAGCGESSELAERTETDQAGSAVTNTSDVAEGEISRPDTEAISSEDASSFDTLSLMVDTVRQSRNTFVASCMSNLGFPQLTEAALLRSAPTNIVSYSPLRADPLEFGPYTEAQAREFGMEGTNYQFRDSEPGSVVSKDRAWDATFDDCKQSYDDQVGTSVQEVTSAFTDLVNELGSEFNEATDDSMYPLIEARLRCLITEAYPTLDIDALLSTESFAEILALTGGTLGVVTNEGGPETEAEAAVRNIRDGEVKVLPPAPPVEYEPSASEVELALAWADCAEQTGFIDALNDLQTQPRADILARHELTILGLIEAIEALNLP